MHSCPLPPERGDWHREVTDAQSRLPTLLHELPPAPGPLGELLRVRLLDARPFVQAVHEVAAQAVAVIDPLHGPLIVPDLGDRSTLGGLGRGAVPTCQPLREREGLTLFAVQTASKPTGSSPLPLERPPHQ